MSRDLILINSSNYKGNNRYEYRFKEAVDFSKYKIQLVSFSMYNTTYNITKALGNNKFSIKWINDVTYDYVIPDGYYSFDDLSLYMNYCMLNDHLLVNTTTGAVFFINISANSIQVKAQININYVPSASEASGLGYTIPNNAWSFPTNPVTPQLIISAGLQKLCGFEGGITPEGYKPPQTVFPLTPQTQNEQFVSTSLAVLSPTYCIILTCDLLNSRKTQVPTLLGQIPIDVSIGALIKYETSANNMLPMSNRKDQFLRINLYNQDMDPLQFVDWEITITLALEELDIKPSDQFSQMVNLLQVIANQTK
jgi:hypothetical protein